MANDNNIKNFTAIDIEKYHKGLLSPKEMHDLERAALDDPFLADALEGYAVSGVNVDADIADLKKRLAPKEGTARVIPMQPKKNNSFPWLRVAVVLLLIAGAGLLAYQFLFKPNDNTNSIALKPEQKKVPPINPPTQQQQSPGDTSFKQNAETNPAMVLKEPNKNDDESNLQQREKANIATTDNRKDILPSNPAVPDNDRSIAVTVTPDAAKEKDSYKFGETVTAQKSGDSLRQFTDQLATNESLEALAKKRDAKSKAPAGVVAMQNKTDAQGYANNNSFSDYSNAKVYRGRITDASNNALPFANITNTRDNVGTWSDAQGNFILVSPDSVLNVQVRSLGFQNRNIALMNSVADNKVVLQEDRNIPTDTLDKVKRNIRRNRNNAMTLEDPEPEDGWDSYGSYVVNNLVIPEKFDMKRAGETSDNTVEVSFEVNKNGEPVNMRVEKSLCDKCDEEAKRLIKDGPKWKRKTKKSKRTTVAIPFIKTE